MSTFNCRESSLEFNARAASLSERIRQVRSLKFAGRQDDHEDRVHDVLLECLKESPRLDQWAADGLPRLPIERVRSRWRRNRRKYPANLTDDQTANLRSSRGIVPGDIVTAVKRLAQGARLSRKEAEFLEAWLAGLTESGSFRACVADLSLRLGIDRAAVYRLKKRTLDKLRKITLPVAKEILALYA